ncbi:hypothetical protein [Streptomyces sp. NRRL S-350]|uniref:hypothetical protein n=1 Tax=Streptomyces sp. NRRL S-350 TaxID=1463902 RepID=UPI00068C9F4E|nr:hypothetical protein [Streptomyces sp. NRRL S-350]
MTGAERDAAVRHWLLAALPDGERTAAADDWKTRGVTVLPCGTLYSAVRLPADIVAEAAGSTDRAAIDRYLAVSLDGPVFCTGERGLYVALVPPSTARTWSLSGVSFLGRGSVVTVPAPGLTRDLSPGAYWAVPMESPGVLCLAEDVANVATRGLRRGGCRA